MILVSINDNNTDFDKVVLKSTNSCQPTPHCKQHGAMNKVSVFENGGYWRCCTTGGDVCRAGCIETKKAINQTI